MVEENDNVTKTPRPDLPWDALKNGIDKIAIRKIAAAIDQPGVLTYLMAYFLVYLTSGFKRGDTGCIACLYVLHYAKENLGDEELDYLAKFCAVHAQFLNFQLDKWYDEDIDGADIVGRCLGSFLDIMDESGIEFGRKVLPHLEDDYELKAGELLWKPLAWLSFDATPDEKKRLIEICRKFLIYAKDARMDESSELVTAAAILSRLAPALAARHIQEYIEIFEDDDSYKLDIELLMESLEGEPVEKKFISPAGHSEIDIKKTLQRNMSDMLEYRDWLRENGYIDEDLEF